MSQILHYSDLEKLGHGSRWTIRRKIDAGILPQPVDFGDGRPAWFADEVEAHLRERAKPWHPVGDGPAERGELD